MSRRAWVVILFIFLTGVIFSIFGEYKSLANIDLNSYLPGLFLGIAIGCVAGMLLAGDLASRIYIDRIGEYSLKRLPVYILALGAIVSLYWFNDAICDFLAITGSHNCATAIIALLHGVFVTTFLVVFIWIFLWEYRYKRRLYW